MIAPSRLAERYVVSSALKRAAFTDDTLSHIMAGMGMLLAQAVIVSNQFFDEPEIRKYLALRRQYHDTFAEACEDLAEAMEAGTFGESVKATAAVLQQVGAIPANNAQRALRLAAKALRGLKSIARDLGGDRRLVRIVFLAHKLAADRSEHHDNRMHVEFLKELLKVQIVPAAVRTLFRKAIKHMPSYEHVSDKANPGAWFEMDPKRKESIRSAYVETVKERDEVYDKIQDPEKRQEEYRRLQRKAERIRNVAGVNADIIQKADEDSGPPLEEVLKRESKLQVDGPTEYIQEAIEKYFRNSYEKDGKLPREYGKVLTQLKKARTLDTVRRVLAAAKAKRIIFDEAAEQLENLWAKVGKNLAVKKGVKLTPLKWEPIAAEDFQKKHSTGRIKFDEAMSEEERRETLGRVSRALEDLEGIFGKGFCGKHAKPLEFSFEGATGFAAASYFAWDDRRNWQPRVKFGEDYAGLLAHELSHYFDDLLANKIEQIENPEHYRRFPEMSRDLFGMTGVSLENSRTFRREPLLKVMPELAEFMDAVLESRDYARWKDMAGSAHDMGLYPAIESLTGKSPYDLPPDHPYRRVLSETPRFKSEWPPELLEATEKAYVRMNDGDGRKLTYYHSAVEIWARMVEQYVATKLADAGIANPWLTQLTYDIDELPQMMEQPTFEKKIVPILDRVFARIKERSLVATRVARAYMMPARVADRYLEAKTKAKGQSFVPEYAKAMKALEGGDGEPMRALAQRIIKVVEGDGKRPEWLAALSTQKLNAVRRVYKGAQVYLLNVSAVKEHPALLPSIVRDVADWAKPLRTLELATVLEDKALEITRGPFVIVPIPGVTKAQADEALTALDEAVSKLRPKCPKVLYGKVFLSTHLAKGKAAWYEASSDTFSLNVLAKKRFDDIFTIIHELGHRHEHKFLSRSARTKYWDLSTRSEHEVIHFDAKLREQMADEFMSLVKLKALGKPMPDMSETLMWWIRSPHPTGDVRRLGGKFVMGEIDEKELRAAVKGKADGDVMTDKVVRGPLHVTPYGATKPSENYADGFAHFVLGMDMPAELAAILAEELK